VPADSTNQIEIDEFWDAYKQDGIQGALAILIKRHGNLKSLEGEVPYLVSSAKEKEIDLIQFIKELDEYMSEAKIDDTTRTSDDGGELRTDSSSEPDSTEDQSQPEPDGPDDSGTNGTTDD
jgi:hypothetical protein